MKPRFRIEVYDGPDKNGAYHYALFWIATYHPGHPAGEHRTAERVQHFRAPLPKWKRVLDKDVDTQ